MEVLLKFKGHSSGIVKMCNIGTEVLATVSETGELAFWNLRIAQDLACSKAVQFRVSNALECEHSGVDDSQSLNVS
jgi:hypothetical protein